MRGEAGTGLMPADIPSNPDAYEIIAMTNNKSGVIAGETRTTDAAVATLVANHYRSLGHHVVQRQEG